MSNIANMSVAQLKAFVESVIKTTPIESDSSTPNYLTVNPVTGQVGASFTGVVQAQGLYIPIYNGAGHNPPPEQCAIHWTDTGSAGETDLAILRYSRNQSAPLLPHILSAVVENGFAASIIASDGSSSFLQLAVTQLLTLAIGSDTVTWPGGGTTSNARAVNTPFTPLWFSAFYNGVPGGGLNDNPIMRGAGMGVNTFSVQGITPAFVEPANATAGFVWAAIG